MKRQRDEDQIELLTKEQLAAYFKTSIKTVERMFDDGLESFKNKGKRYVTRDKLNDYVRKHQQSA